MTNTSCMEYQYGKSEEMKMQERADNGHSAKETGCNLGENDGIVKSGRIGRKGVDKACGIWYIIKAVREGGWWAAKTDKSMQKDLRNQKKELDKRFRACYTKQAVRESGGACTL